MKKISYSLVFNRKKKLNKKGMALVQVEAYLNRRKMYFSTRVYLKPEQWDVKREVVSKRWHNLFFTFYSPAIFSFAYDAFF